MNHEPLPLSSQGLPAYTWVGLLILLTAQASLFAGNEFVATWLTPIMWSGYILTVDGFNYRMAGDSWLTTRRREFPLLCLLSVAIWLLFEVYNFHLQNWTYQGVPENPLLRDIGYFWSFATIMPGVFVTADLAKNLLARWLPNRRRRAINAGPSWAWFLTGLSLVTIPLALPVRVARYLFGAVWIGFVLLIDPINERLGIRSLRVDLRTGKRSAIVTLLCGGIVCGLLWETWNYQAYLAKGAHWVYTIPEPLHVFGLHFGKMPVLGLLGFPPFALELYLLYGFLRELLVGDIHLHGRGLTRK